MPPCADAPQSPIIPNVWEARKKKKKKKKTKKKKKKKKKMILGRSPHKNCKNDLDDQT